jgi:hypothetical protein
MEDKFLRYSKLYILIFLMFLSIPVIIGLIIAFFYGFSKLISSAPIDILFEMLIVSIPAAIFTTAYVIFFKRTKQHPSNIVRIISRILFASGFCCCCVFLVLDMILFFTRQSYDVTNYRSFSTIFLAGNIGGLFLIAIMQAFTTQKEKDWLEKRREKDMSSLN